MILSNCNLIYYKPNLKCKTKIVVFVLSVPQHISSSFVVREISQTKISIIYVGILYYQFTIVLDLPRCGKKRTHWIIKLVINIIGKYVCFNLSKLSILFMFFVVYQGSHNKCTKPKFQNCIDIICSRRFKVREIFETRFLYIQVYFIVELLQDLFRQILPKLLFVTPGIGITGLVKEWKGFSLKAKQFFNKIRHSNKILIGKSY